MSDLLTRIDQHFTRLRPQTLREPDEQSFIKYPYGVPAGFYDQLWDWDGFFINTHFANRDDKPRPKLFRYWVLNFLHAYKELGYPPGCVTQKAPETDRRDFSLKPFMAQSAYLASEAEGDYEWLRPHFRDLVEIVTRREKTHRDEQTGLFYWDDAMASGADNNAADSNVPELKGLYLSADLNSFQYLEYKALAKIAHKIGIAEDDLLYEHTAHAIKDAMHKHLWNAGLGNFDNKRRDTGSFVACISYSSFVPYWAGIATQDQADEALPKHLLSPAMMTEWGARSLSREDRSYNNANIIIPYSNWCGPIWPIANWFYFVGLKNYGFDTEAKDLAERVAKLVLTDLDAIGSMHESYCSETGQTLAPSIDQAPRYIEGGFIGWNLLVQDMLEQS